MAKGGAELIHDGPHLQALVKRGESPFVFVTFGPRGFRADGRSIWAEPLVDKMGLNAIGFVTHKPNWFPAEDLADALRAAEPFLAPFAERIGYGYSQGGYAVIRAARALGLSRAIAVSPQWSIDPDDIVDERYNRFFDAEANRGMALTAADAPERLAIIADTAFADDRGHLARIMEAMPRAEIVPVPATDHKTMKVLRGTSGFADLLAAARADMPLLPIVARMRRASPLRREVLIARALARRQTDRAYRLIKAQPMAPDMEALSLARFAAAGEALRVIADARALVRREPEHAYARAAFAYVLASAGRDERAREVALKAEAMSRHRLVQRLTRAVKRGKLGIALDDEDDDG